MTLPIHEAFMIATEVHARQLDKAGAPYLFHVMRVAMAMRTEEEIVVALLHDAVEDSPVARRKPMLLGILSTFGPVVADAVAAISRHRMETYENYIGRISGNDLAVRVKLKDLDDHLRNFSLTAILSQAEVDRLRSRWNKAECILEDVFRRQNYEQKEKKYIW